MDADRPRKAFGLLDARFGRSPRAFAWKLGNGDYRPFTARNLDRAIAVERLQLSLSVSLSSPSSLSGCEG
jgi:hypothetical protein